MTILKPPTPENIKHAASILREGGLVAMPTETVYGLAANALDGQAVAGVYEAKGRPAFNPLITHVCGLKEAKKYGAFSEQALAVAHHFWPGPLTLILPRAQGCEVSELATAGLDTIALRAPAHPVAQYLIKECGFPLVAPSANPSGSLSPTTPAHVSETLGDKISMILAAGKCEIGVESTVLDMSTNTPVILRPGAITAEDIARILGEKVIYHHETTNTPKSPGQTLKHYAPNTPLRLNAVDVEPGEALLAFGSLKFMGVRGGGKAQNLPDTALCNLSETQDLHEAAANLFAMLKFLDRPEHTRIAVMNIPETGLGIAINDRLRRASVESS